MKFKIEINLDDPQEVTDFIKEHGKLKGPALARKLGFTGPNAGKAATALSRYAWNKQAAIKHRKNGKIAFAKMIEKQCDWIYQDDIQGIIECW